MFKVMGGKINVFGRWVAMEEGAHTISIDSNSGSTYTDSSSGAPVVSYTLDAVTGHVTINSHIPSAGKSGEKPIESLDWRGMSVVSRGPLFEEPLGVATKDITVLLEGFLFSFNYYALVNIASALKPFRWVGGRVCFDSMLTVPDGSTQGKYTAVPSAMSCGSAGWGLFNVESAVMPILMGGFSFLNAVQRDAIEFYGNSTSIVFSYRTHRKYMFFASNVDGLFESSMGPIGGSASSSPANGAIPDIGGVGFQFSMFSLRQ